jgi:hypothetical protein
MIVVPAGGVPLFSLREFWFPVLLFLSSIAAGLFAVYSGKAWRRAMTLAAVFLFVFSVIAYFFGDPVRGPFTYLTHPNSDDKFTFHAGVAAQFPFKQLGEGIDFSQVVTFKESDGTKQPLYLWIKKTWPFGWQVKAKLYNGKESRLILDFDEKKINYITPDADLNYDDRAIELVGNRDYLPVFQLVFAENDDVYVNAFILTPDRKEALIMDGSILKRLPADTLQPKDLPQRLFKYPSYSHPRERE